MKGCRPFSRLEAQTVVRQITPLQLADVSQFNPRTLIVHRLVGLTLSTSRYAPTTVTYIDDSECLDVKL
jgi:hypothetical protein